MEENSDENRLIPKNTIREKLKELEMSEKEYTIFLLFKILKKVEQIVQKLEEKKQ